MGKSFWTCKQCEGKAADFRSVINSINTIKTELTTLKKGQAEQQAETSKQQAEQNAERAKVLDGLKAVEKVAKRLDQIEEVQVKHGQKLSTHDDALGLHEDSIKRIKSKAEEGEKRMKKMEDQIEKIIQNGVDAPMQCSGERG